MPCNVTESNWLTDIKGKIACGLSNNIPVEQMVSASIGFQIETLLCKCPTILDGEGGPACDISAGLTLTGIYNRLKCGTTLTAAQIAWAQANIFIKQKECCDNTDAVDAVDTFEIVAAGIHTWVPETAPSDSIPVVGLLATDIIQVTLVAVAGSEVLNYVLNDHANDQIDVTLSTDGGMGVTKLSYTVLRAS